MFAEKTPMRLTGCNGKTTKNADGERQRIVVLTFQLQPFTAEMAGDLNVKARLFAVGDGNPLPDVASAALRIDAAPQRLRIFEVPDIEKPSAESIGVRVAPLVRVRSDKEGPVYSATVSLELAYPTADELLWLFHRVTDQVFVTLEAEQSQLFSA